MKEASRKEWGYGALVSGNWVEGRRDYFRGRGKLEGDIQLRSTPRERLQPEICQATLLPKVHNMGELVLGESMGGGGPRSLRGHGRTPAGMRTSARWPSEGFLRPSQNSQGWSLHKAILQSLKKCYQAV